MSKAVSYCEGRNSGRGARMGEDCVGLKERSRDQRDIERAATLGGDGEK